VRNEALETGGLNVLVVVPRDDAAERHGLDERVFRGVHLQYRVVGRRLLEHWNNITDAIVKKGTTCVGLLYIELK